MNRTTFSLDKYVSDDFNKQRTRDLVAERMTLYGRVRCQGENL